MGRIWFELAYLQELFSKRQPSADFGHDGFKPREEHAVRAVPYPQPDDCRGVGIGYTSRNEIFILCQNYPKFQMLPSSESRNPNSRTGVAGNPRSPSQCASDGGNCASTRKRMVYFVPSTVWSRYCAA